MCRIIQFVSDVNKGEEELVENLEYEIRRVNAKSMIKIHKEGYSIKII